MAYPYLKRSFDEATKRLVWAKGAAIAGYDPGVWRRDICGAVMRFSENCAETEHGWEIDHILPVAKGGTDSLANLQPLNWRNNRRKGDTYPWTCS